ncbi:MAG TPA: hypothetical protein VLB82_14295 [Thermodesulfobacteriota bacterium]|nr:hypothetical protein [Thermodesulfobacteriota bacterium]
MLKDRLDRKFSETAEEEWNLIREKIGNGIELPLPDSGRWFLATIDGDSIKIESAKLNVRPIVINPPETITYEEFKQVVDVYPDILKGGVQMMSGKLELQKTMANFKYIFMLIYSLV